MTRAIYHGATEVVAGLGSFAELPSVLDRFSASHIAVVCDAGLASSGLLDQLLDLVPGAEVTVCPLVLPDPSVDDAEAAAAVARTAGADLVIAMGGGSGLVVGKAVGLRLRNEAPLSALVGRDVARDTPAPVVAIPTTAGSGSEVSSVIVLRDAVSPSALVIRGRAYGPSVAILDGSLLKSLPREPMVYAGLDALSHALEALWSKQASRFTDALAVAAADLIFEALPVLVRSWDPEASQALIEASAMANLACGSSELALVHALSLAAAVKLPHGYQNGVLLPLVGEFNRPSLSAQAGTRVDRLSSLYEALAFTPRFAAGEIGLQQAMSMLSVGYRTPLRLNNIRSTTIEELRDILIRAGAPLDGVDVSVLAS